MPVLRVGSHRRLRIQDVLLLREERQRNRRSALAELSDLGQELQDRTKLTENHELAIT
jgi:hypothetical protein